MKDVPLPLTVALVLAPLLAIGQTPPPAENEVIELAPFVVAATADDSYAPSEVISGTRIRASVRDLPFNVNVITSQFIEDFDLSDLSEALSFNSSVTPNDITPNSTNTRGFSGTPVLRNGMSFFGLFTRSNLERVEVVKGPYAAIYGKTQPGGLTNMITRRPAERERQTLALSAGSFDYKRMTFSSTGPIGSRKLLYRIDGGSYESGGTQEYKYARQHEMSGAISYEFSRNTSVLVEVSRMQNLRTRVAPLVWLRDPVTNQYLGKMTEDFYFNRAGPGGEDGAHAKWFNTNVYGTFDHRFTPWLTMRLSGVWWSRNQPALAMGGNTYLYTNTRNIINLNPFISDIRREAHQGLADLLATFRTGPVIHHSLISFTYSEEDEYNWQRNLSAAELANPSVINRVLNVDAPSWFYPAFNDPTAYTSLTRDRAQTVRNEAVFFSHRAELFNRRLKAYLGGRYDRITSRLLDYQTNLDQQTTASDFSPQFGFNFALTPVISLYGSYSESYTPQSQVRTNTNELYPNEEGVGVEGGIKAVVMDGKVTFTATYYEIKRINVLQTYTDEQLGMRVTEANGEVESKGYEIDYNWQVTPSLQLLGGVGITDSQVTKNLENPERVGLPLPRGPADYNFSSVIVYKIGDGRLKGVRLRAAVRGQGKSLGEYGTGPYTRGGITYATDGRNDLWQPSFTRVDIGTSYSWRSGKRLRHSVSFNVRNLLDKKYSTGNWIPADRINASATYSLRY